MRIFLLYLTFLTINLNAIILDNNKLDQISKKATWLKLLHYNSSTHKSSLSDKNFFLDKRGNVDAKKELIATLKAYSQPFDSNSSERHAQCRFPARYFWLSKEIDLPNYTEVNSRCSKLSKWKLLKNTHSISVVFVSGYLGNPASAFGHSFFKINQSEDENKNLFDTTISYGALLPPKYGMPEYIYNGLTGGYDAAYSDKYYYNQDITYSNQEFRDMWEFRLHLTDEQKKLFLLHAWELMGKKFQYFFLNRNCGYKVAEFLELIYDKPLIDSASIWYAPIETFYKLKDMDVKGRHKIIDKIIYIPSKQQKIYEAYKGLSSLEKKIVKEMIEQELSDIPTVYQTVKKDTQGNVLDFILAYRKYKFEKDDMEIDKKVKAFNRQLILNRLKLPIAKKNNNKIQIKETITKNNRPSYLGISRLENKSDISTLFHVAPFAIEKEGYNNFYGDELVVLDTEMSIDKNKFFIRQCDLIRIQRLKTKEIPFDNSNPLSWNLDIGSSKKNDSRDYFVDGGLGLAWDTGEYMKFYSMLNISVHTDDRHYRYMPNIGLYGNFNRLRLVVDVGIEKDIEKEEEAKIITLKSQYKIKDDFSIFMNYNSREKEDIQIGLKWFY